MSNGQFTERQRTLLRDLKALAADRQQAEADTERRYRDHGAAAEKDFRETTESLEERYLSDTKAEQEAYRKRVRQVESDGKTEYEATQLAQEAERERILEKAERNEQEARKQWDEAVWVAETVYEASEHQPEEHYRQTESEVEARRERLTTMTDEAKVLLRKYRQKLGAIDERADTEEASPPETDEAEQPDAAGDSRNALAEQEKFFAIAQYHLIRLSRLTIARLFRGYLLAFLVIVISASAGVLAAWQQQWQINQAVAITVGVTVVGLGILIALLFVIAKRQVAAIYRPFLDAIEASLRACDECLAPAAAERDRREVELLDQRNRETDAAREKYKPIIEEIRQRRDSHLKRIENKYPKLLEEIVQRREHDLKSAKEKHDQRLADITEQYESDSKQTRRRYEDRMREREERHAQEWASLESAWKEGMARCHASITAITAENAELFPEWDDSMWEKWAPPQTFSPSIRFGALDVNLSRIPGGIPEDERLIVPVPTQFTLPAALDFPEPCSLLIVTDGEARDQAVATLQTVMLRMLTSLPPGKVRFTIIDPVGLGQNFAGFMHLADYEESFVASRIWTETRHIEQRLTDLTEHMENVIQKYLRNEFETIADYNIEAGEIAEPYRFLVISDFPANFSETAVRRLASIISSGARCGVYTLIAMDKRMSIPVGIAKSDLEQHSTTLVQKDGGFEWQDEAFKEWPLTIEQPPSEEFLTAKLHLIGEASKDATRVEVPFSVIAPTDEAIWGGDCAAALSVPLGRCGATKLQKLIVGPGTSQHVLIAGKTGSGKSTLLHVLITNLALWYSPDEVQFYLIDFKKGVEFKTYANHNLPHARAVAIESDREFGLSVLQRVDRELRQRGDRFRELGVQDLAGYRNLGLDEPMPRTLLIIDEFQEMFVEDDKIGQDAALLMDRLVRQGRAFGIHVMLGSQTLGGAYTLARSTIGQMQVRVALQCSEADSYLIMSDDNSAARLLSRPGEAIYNDAGGAIEGNNPFQIVWLPDHERERRLRHVEELARQRRYVRSEPQIVFEGNAPAELRGNHLLEAALDQPNWPGSSGSSQTWLGEAIAIKGPTAATFGRQSGHNLLIVGQRDEAALVMIATALLGLAAQHRPGPDGAKFYLLDGSPIDSPHAGYLDQIAGMIPHEVKSVKWRDVPEAMTTLSEELARRQELEVPDVPPVFLLIYGLQRFRMLRTVDEFSFSADGEGKPPSADKQFSEILRDGPPMAMHTITWCDTTTNLTRTLERQGLREFEMRVLFQMSSADSTQLVDSPLAGRLGLRRAMFYNEEEGVLEKFRPYGLPNHDWLDSVRERLAAKTVADPNCPTR